MAQDCSPFPTAQMNLCPSRELSSVRKFTRSPQRNCSPSLLGANSLSEKRTLVLRDRHQGIDFSRAGPEFTRVITTQTNLFSTLPKGVRAAPDIRAKHTKKILHIISRNTPSASHRLLVNFAYQPDQQGSGNKHKKAPPVTMNVKQEI